MKVFFRSTVSVLLVIFTNSIYISAAPDNYPKASSAEQRKAGYEQREKLKENSLVKNVPFRSVGPTVMSGRVIDLDVNPEDPTQFYVAYASGGLWVTRNNGITFDPLFDNQEIMTIGDIAVDWKHGETIWIGTGENNSSRSSYSGTGIYKSADLGKTWEYSGLPESHHIGRIIVHPENPDIIWVAALGHLYSPNKERGLYKSVNGGKTWKNTLFIDENTGAIDLVIDPASPDILYAAMWERARRAWNFTESGQHSGIYKSLDGGENWQLISTETSGFPAGEGIGRIGLAIYPKDPQILYSYLDNQNHRKKEEKDQLALTKEMLVKMSGEEFLRQKSEDINAYLDEYGFPLEYNADTLLALIKNKSITPKDLVEYLGDANEQLFDTPVIGGEIYKSTNGGATWEKTHEGYLDNLVYTYGYYFGEVRVHPNHENTIYILGVPVLKSEDGGKTFHGINQDNVHADHHALWINPKHEGHIILGNDGGLNISYDDGKNWINANSPAVGQFYSVAVDDNKPYNIYGGLQDNGVWVGPSTYKASAEWQQSGHYPYRSLLGGDGMQVAIDTRTNDIIYTGYQFGYYYRINNTTSKSVSIKPKHTLGEKPYRFNWQSPIHLSIHNQDIVYFGSQFLHRSLDKGDHWENISGDLTKGSKKGDVPYATLTTIHESPLKFGLIYTGSDDGLIHVTKDGGVTWNRISDKLDPDWWVSRVQASSHEEGTVYASLNGYRWDNFESRVYKSTDYGKYWTRIGTDLPAEPVNVIKEDPVNPDVLYVGTDHGLYVSLNSGKSFMAFSEGLPDAPVHDLVIQKTENDLVVGTHGRSIYVANVKPVQKLTEGFLKQPLYIFPIEDITYSKNWGELNFNWDYREPSGAKFLYYSQKEGIATIQITGKEDFLIKSLLDTVQAGLNYFSYNLIADNAVINDYQKLITPDSVDSIKEIKPAKNNMTYLIPGDYTIKISVNGNSSTSSFVLKKPEKPERKKTKKTP